MSATTQPKHIAWKNVEREQLNPLIDREMVVGDKIMLARVLLKRGAHVPMHHHHNEQVTYILEGALKFAIDGKEVVVRAGEVLCIPSNMPHEAWALEDTVDLDVFNQPPVDRSALFFFAAFVRKSVDKGAWFVYRGYGTDSGHGVNSLSGVSR